MVLSPTHQASIAVIVLLGGTFTAHTEVSLAAPFGSSPLRHVQALQEIADAHQGNRAAGTPGFDRSADYVANQLRHAGYNVRFEEFTFPFFDERSPPLFVAGPTHPSPYTPPGMNDNASGAAAVVEAALRLAGEPATGIPIRFAFWGAEERGLLGSRHHLSVLPEAERRRIALYINLDMVGSPNFGRFIQHTSENSSGLVARTVASLNHSLAQHSLPMEERTRRSRGLGSDDASFAAESIPTISLFTGAGGVKNEAQAQQFGGSAGQPFDSCYHKACDTVANISEQVLKQITDALTNALHELASH